MPGKKLLLNRDKKLGCQIDMVRKRKKKTIHGLEKGVRERNKKKGGKRERL